MYTVATGRSLLQKERRYNELRDGKKIKKRVYKTRVPFGEGTRLQNVLVYKLKLKLRKAVGIQLNMYQLIEFLINKVLKIVFN